MPSTLNRTPQSPISYESVDDTTVTQVLDANYKRLRCGVFNETGNDIYVAFVNTAPANTNTMFLLKDGEKAIDDGESVHYGAVYVYQASGGTLNVKVMEG